MTAPNREVPANPSSGSVVFQRTLVRALVYPVLLLTLLIVVFIWQLGNVLKTTDRVEHSNVTITQASTVLKLLVDMETGLRGYLLTHDDRFIGPYTEAQAAFDDTFKTLQAMVADDTAQTRRLNDAWVNIVDWRQKAVDILAKAPDGSAIDTAVLLNHKQLMDSVRQSLADFVEAENRLREERISTTQSTSQFVILSVVIGGLVVGVILAIITVRQLTGLSKSYEQALQTSQHHSEELLTQREWLRGVLSSIGDGVIATDIRGNITFINQVTSQLTGWSAEEAGGKPIAEVYKVVREEAKLEVGKPLASSSSGDITALSNDSKQLIARDGSDLPIEDNLTYIKDPYGTPIGTVVVFRDISRRKSIEQKRVQLDAQLEAERQRLANIIATVPGIFWENEYNAETSHMKPIFISAYVEPMLGYTVDEALAQPDFWYKIIHPDDAQRVVDEFYAIRQSGKAGVVSFRALHKDGYPIDIDAYMMAIMEGGKPVGTRGVMMDVSERQRLMNAQTRYAAMLRRSNEQLQQFAYITSHDLQEPLRMVISYMQLLERRYANALDSDAHEFINYAVDGAARMKELIAGLLQYSRLDGDQDIYESVDAQEILDRALSNLSVTIDDSHAVITHDTLPQVQADSLQLMQLFQNLIGNAIKFRSEQPLAIHIGVEKKTDEWQFSVRDNGIGIAPEYRDRIFAMFQRLHNRTEYAGTGIGLAICKKIVERHGGHIWVESAEGEGATFYFTLPLKSTDPLGTAAVNSRTHSY